MTSSVNKFNINKNITHLLHKTLYFSIKTRIYLRLLSLQLKLAMNVNRRLFTFINKVRLINNIRGCSSLLKDCMRFDFSYLCDEKNLTEIESNIKNRKGVGDINHVRSIYKDYLSAKNSNIPAEELGKLLYEEAKKIPNKTHPLVQSYGADPQIIKHINDEPKFEGFEPLEFADIVRFFNIMRTDQLGAVTGHRSYYFMSDLAELEEALIKYSVNCLLDKGFQLVSVPDVLPSDIIESCGMATTGERTQVYSLDSLHHGADQCLSGTAEMSLAGLLMHTEHDAKSLPLKLAAVSRCYRAESSNVIEQRGIYRVHQFTKVEMFGVTCPQDSEAFLEEFRSIEEEIFTNLGLYMRVLDMPPHELGAPAYRKYDIEAWMPGRKLFGEISSCSNCTDYQARRLDIKYSSSEGTTGYAHTLNGTACAVPRMLIAILETHQSKDGKVAIPKVLQKYISGKKYISKKRDIPNLKIIKVIK